MPTDANGVYSLPPGYLATDGNLIQASQHNPPLEDLASSMTGRMPRNGNAAMTGALKIIDGSSSAPAVAFASATGTGIFKTANGFAIAVNGVQVFEFTAVSNGVLIGTIIDYAGQTPPTGWQFCFGQSLLRASYPDLFVVLGTNYGAADGSHFSLPDCRGVTCAGRDDMGAIARGMLTGAIATGILLGSQTVSIGQGNIPSYTLPNSLGVSRTGAVALSGAITGVVNTVSGGGANLTGGGGALLQGNISINDTQSFGITGSVTSGGSGTALANVQPTLVMNKLIFAGA